MYPSREQTMRIALNWYEVTLPTSELVVAVQTVATAQQGELLMPKSPRYQRRVVQRRGGTAIRLLHVTDVPPSGTTVETINTNDDPNFVKIAIEEGFALLLAERGFSVHRKHVGSTACLQTDESLWPAVYTFWRGLSFRAFYFFGTTGVRWGIVLNYVTSQRFCVTLKDPRLRALALGKSVVRVSDSHDSEEYDHRRSGILQSTNGSVATVDLGNGDPLEAPVGEWTLPCRRELLHEYVMQTQGQKAAAELTRRLQQAAFCLTESGRMNTALARSQVEAVQELLHHHDLGRIFLPLPARPPASLSNRPLTVVE